MMGVGGFGFGAVAGEQLGRTATLHERLVGAVIASIAAMAVGLLVYGVVFRLVSVRSSA